MVPAWIAVAAWLVSWTALAWLSLRLLGQARPGQQIPLRIKVDGSGAWMVSPVVAAGLTPLLAVIAGGVTIGAGYVYGGGRAPIMNVLLAGVFVFTHGVYVRRAGEWLANQR
jgi:hypothetical protein